jgi:DNA-binding MurR/RpiR family transcriptional regulator
VKKSLSTSDQLDKTISNIDHAGYLREIYDLERQNLSQTFQLNNASDIEDAVAMICRARKLIIAGLGLSTSVVRFLSGRLRRIGKEVIEINATGHVLVENMAMATKDDLLIAFSFPSYSRDMPKVFRHMQKELGGKTLLISDSRLGETQRFCDLVLLAASDSLAFTNSMVGAFMLANMLSVGVALTDQEESREQLKKNQLLADDLGHSFSSLKNND